MDGYKSERYSDGNQAGNSRFLLPVRRFRARLRIGLNPAIADSGIPEVPMIGTVVGLPSCSNVSVEVIEEAVEVIDDWYQLYPRPALRVEQLPNGSEVVVEHYYKNETAYQTPSYSPLSAQPPAFPVE